MNNISKLFLVTFFFSTFKLKFIKPSLEKLVKTPLQLKKIIKTNDKSNPEFNSAKIDLENIDNLAEKIANNLKPIGQGSYGKVFKFDYLPDLNSNSIKAVGKNINIGNDYNYAHDRTMQNLIEIEINISKKLSIFDPNHLFLPEVFGIFDVTNYFDLFIDEYTLDENKDYLIGDINSEQYLILMEYMDISFFDFLNDILLNSLVFLFHTVVRIGQHLIRALQLIYSEYTHCDVKPENIMFKEISIEKVNQLREYGIQPLQLYPGKFYQLRLIDFGLAAYGTPEERRCIGGTPVYLSLIHI